MKKALYISLFALACCIVPASAQAGRPIPPGLPVDRIADRLEADRLEFRAGPITGSVNRSAIPNEYLEVNVARGSVHIEGSASDRAEWTVVTKDWATYVRSDSGTSRPLLTSENHSLVGTTTWKDRYTVDLRVEPGAKRTLHADVQLRVPRDLKLLHVTVHGEGDVIVDNFAGEITVTADSGTIAGTNLSGPVLLESRSGGINVDLADSPFQVGPVNLLSHNGSIGLLLPSQASVTLDLSANCGNVNLGFPVTEANLVPGSSLNPPAVAAQDLDCGLRPKSLPPLPGVVHLHNSAKLMLGAGTIRIRAMALQADINVRQKGDAAIGSKRP